MKKTIIIVCISVILTGLAFFLLSPRLSELKKRDIHIAFAGGINGNFKTDVGTAVNGIKLYIDKINKAGGIEGRKIKLRLFDDKDRPDIAMKVASEIGEDKDILLVIGHFLSSTSLAAGKLYKRYGIPVITASATATAVTAENEWYFRVIPHNAFQGIFIAYYCRTLSSRSVCFVFQNDPYGLSVAEPFERTVQDIGLEIKIKESFDAGSKNANEQLEKIAYNLSRVEEPGVIFLALYPDIAAKLIIALKQSGKPYSIIGTDTLTSESFIEEFKKNDLEKTSPGYYSDNIYSTSPFLMDTANEKAYFFRKEFIKEYGGEPPWLTASHYDAAATAVEAIRKTGIQDDGTVQLYRKKIRSSLAAMSNSENGIKGVGGYINFDKNGDSNRPLSVGFYKNHRFIPAFSMYEAGAESEQKKDILEGILEGRSIRIGNLLLNKTDVVYTGIAVNEISNLNLKKGTCTADFYLWFRYKGDLNIADIRFVNSVMPVQLDSPISDVSEDGIRLRLYRLQADFRMDTDFRRYPFDSQTVCIRFCHERLTREELIYVSDVWGQPETVRRKHSGKIKLESGERWKVTRALSYQDIITYSSSIPDALNSRQTVNYSRFNTEILIDRQNFREIKAIFPIALIMTGLYAVCFIRHKRYNIRALSLTVILTATVFFHRELAAGLKSEYITVVGYAFFTEYLLIALSLLLTGLLFTLDCQGKTEKQKQIVLAEKILYPCLVFAAALMMMFIA